MKKKGNTKKLLIISVAVFAVVVLVVLSLFSQSTRRWFKDIFSDYGGGLNRTVTVYDYNGNAIESYSGKFDVEYKSDGTVKFDIDGKRTTITGGIIINQEE